MHSKQSSLWVSRCERDRRKAWTACSLRGLAPGPYRTIKVRDRSRPPTCTVGLGAHRHDLVCPGPVSRLAPCRRHGVKINRRSLDVAFVSPCTLQAKVAHAYPLRSARGSPGAPRAPRRSKGLLPAVGKPRGACRGEQTLSGHPVGGRSPSGQRREPDNHEVAMSSCGRRLRYPLRIHVPSSPVTMRSMFDLKPGCTGQPPLLGIRPGHLSV
jgi:hypothetical protein